MEKWELEEIVDVNTGDIEKFRFIMDAVDAYTSALLKQCNVSGQSEQLPQITHADYKQVQKILYPADNSKKFRR